jgi:hypothetical protein
MAKYLTQPQTAERLSGWQGGSQGKAAKEKAKRTESKTSQSSAKHNLCENQFT